MRADGKVAIAHALNCRYVPADAVEAVTTEVLAADRLTRYHDCIRYIYSPPSIVLLAEQDDDGHRYEPSMIWPGGEDRPRCFHCRGTHPEEDHWQYRDLTGKAESNG